MWTILALALLLTPLIEIYVIIQVGQVIGAGWTILLLVLESAFGAWIVKREGKRAWVALRDSFSTGRLPTRELTDGALVLVGGTLLLTPGFVTDAIGFLIVLPLTRPFARRLLAWMVARRVNRASQRAARRVSGGWSASPGAGPWDQRASGGTGTQGSAGSARGDVVPGEVVEDDDR